MASSPQFLRAHQEAQKAVATFLPSLGPNPPAPPPPPPHPLQKRNVMQEMTHAASMARHVEQSSARIAQGLPANPAPPSPEQSFGNALDVIHTRALQSAIASHPEDQRSRLISEAHDSTTKWIASHNGKVVVHGKVMTADSPKAAEKLAAQIVNDTVEEHDQRKKDEADAAAAEQEAGADSGPTRAGGKAGSGRPAAPVSGPDQRQPVGPGSVQPQASPGAATPAAVPPVGGIDPASGRVVTHASDDLDQAQETATAAAPELDAKLQQVADAVPGISVHGVRDKKDRDRAERKTEADSKPVNTHSDLLAGRLVADSPEAKDAAVAHIKSTSPVIDEEDKFQDGDPDYGFRSHDLQVALGDGSTSAEVQVVPKEIADLDDETHKTYEKGRDAEAEGDTDTADQAKAENTEKHDAAMDEFNARNTSLPAQASDNDGGNTADADKSALLRKLLADAGFDVTGDPVRIGGHAFLPIKDTSTDDAPQ